MPKMIEILKRAIRALQDADGELDSTGYAHQHHVRIEVQNSSAELQQLMVMMEQAEKERK